MVEERLIWITGVARSGTTYLARLFNAVPGFRCIVEGLPRVLDDLVVDPRVLPSEDIRRKDVASIHKAMLERVARRDGVRVLAIKQPFPHSSKWHYFLFRNGNAALIVNIFRHPLDVFLSQHDRNLRGAKQDPTWNRRLYSDVTVQCTLWNDNYWWMNNCNPRMVLNVRYEDLMNGHRPLQRVMEFVSPGTDPAHAPAVWRRFKTQRPQSYAGVDPVLGSVRHAHRVKYRRAAAFFKETIREQCAEVMGLRGYRI